MSDTESQPNPLASTLKSQAAVEDVPLSATHPHQQLTKDSPVGSPEVILSMCNVKLVITLISKLSQGDSKSGNKVIHFLKF